MPRIPHEHRLDSSLALLKEGYRFIPNRMRRFGTAVFQTRLLLQDTICLTGEEGARLFYDENLFTREHAAPRMMQKSLLGVGSVQSLDGEAHRIRKAMFMSLMTPSAIQSLVQRYTKQWQKDIQAWTGNHEVALLYAAQFQLCRSVCDWAGVPLPEEDVAKRRSQLASLIDGAGGVGLRHLRARTSRQQAEAWIAGCVQDVREGRLKAPVESALHVISFHREANGQWLDPRTAAVEVLNVLRPTVAVARFVVFAAWVLHRYPQWAERLRQEPTVLEPFVQEVRRVFAFFPFAVARVRKDFEWKGYQFTKGTRVLLDLYGTNRESQNWQQPERFDPERFFNWNGNAFNFITQGGGDHYQNHRCPGEWITIELLKVAVTALTQWMRYEVPPQDLSIDISRMPALPKSRFVISRVHPMLTEEAHQAPALTTP
ncbi:fatty-acid peroxygenase [Pseudomonas duriflava]|uniref:Fatty-acid peroxygenase n=1 Tax=Pseudomonas duriflava TaxID=459528 RepID=A0A562QG68_9PSED|nr:cytochrome P450 [Pseudomonas duriflava]TWI55738.1 fatty-acid peroxygenase [Pseudomonas duriflava]